MKNIENNRGLTLIEMMVSLVILVLIIGVGFTVFSAISNNYEKVNNSTDLQQTTRSILNTIEGKVAYSNKIEVIDDGDSLLYEKNGKYYKMNLKEDEDGNGGYLMVDQEVNEDGTSIAEKEGTLAFSSDYYENKKITTLKFGIFGLDKANVELKVSDDVAGTSYSLDGLLNTTLSTIPYAGIVSGASAAAKNSISIIEYLANNNENWNTDYSTTSDADNLKGSRDRCEILLLEAYTQNGNEYAKAKESEFELLSNRGYDISESNKTNYFWKQMGTNDKDGNFHIITALTDKTNQNSATNGVLFYYDGDYYYHSHGWSGKPDMHWIDIGNPTTLDSYKDATDESVPLDERKNVWVKLIINEEDTQG